MIIQAVLESMTYASRSHAGVHPFIKNPGPSVLSEFVTIFTSPYAMSAFCRGTRTTHTGEFPRADATLCNRLFNTSAGAQTVVATVPAINDAAMWTGTPSEI